VSVVVTATALIARVITDRAVFYRENTSRTYNSLAYAITMTVVEYPFALIATVLYMYATTVPTFWQSRTTCDLTLHCTAHTHISIPFYFISGLQYDAGKFWIFFAVLLLNFLMTFALVQVLSLLAPNFVLASTFCAVAFTLFAIFSGFLISRDNIPPWWIWAHYLGSCAHTRTHTRTHARTHTHTASPR
jgi:ABC-type multidrug transport system permease subunit